MAAIYCQDHHLVEHKISVPDLVFRQTYKFGFRRKGGLPTINYAPIAMILY